MIPHTNGSYRGILSADVRSWNLSEGIGLFRSSGAWPGEPSWQPHHSVPDQVFTVLQCHLKSWWCQTKMWSLILTPEAPQPFLLSWKWILRNSWTELYQHERIYLRDWQEVPLDILSVILIFYTFMTGCHGCSWMTVSNIAGASDMLWSCRNPEPESEVNILMLNQMLLGCQIAVSRRK